MTKYNQIQTKIRKFIHKYFLAKLVRGLILFVLFSFVYLFITALIEYFLWLPPQGRMYLFYAQWVVLGLFFIFFLASPLLNLLGLKKSLSADEAAGMIGKHFPDIDDKLLNTLQLHHQHSHSELLLASIEQKAGKLSVFDFTKAVDFKRALRFIPLLFVPFIILLVLKLTHYDKAITQGYERVLSYRSEFQPPLPYALQLLDFQSPVKGNDLHIKVKLSGDKLPEQLNILLNDKAYQFQKQNDSIFSFYFPVVDNDMDFVIQAGKHRFGPYQIKVINPPVLQQIKTILHYPRYLHKKPEIFSHTGNFNVPESTLIEWQLATKYTDTILFRVDDSIKHYSVKNDRLQIKKSANQSFNYNISAINQAIHSPNDLSYNVKVIKDLFPEIKVQEAKDSIHRQALYRILATDDYAVVKLLLSYKATDESQFISIQIPITKSDLVQANFVFPDTIHLQKGKSYVYFFKAFDNDAVHHFKSVKSQNFYYNKLTDKELEQQNLKQQQQQIASMDHLQQKFSKDKHQLEQLKNKISQSKSLDFESQKQLQHQIQDLKKQDEFFKNAIKKYKDLLQKKADKDDEMNKELQKRLDELAKMEKKKKMLDELQKLAEKLKKEDLVEKLKDFDKYSEHQEKSLERILELTKKYYMQQKMKKLAGKLDQLSQKQDSLSKTNSDTKKQQDALNKQFDSIQKQADSLQKLNKGFKKPMKLPANKADMEEIKQDMQKASENLDQKQSSAANKKQKKAASKMKQMAKQMAMPLGGGGGEQNEEDIATLQAILKSLLNFSFKQEQLLTDLYTHKGKVYLSQQLLQQNALKKYFKHINDSLYTLALRNPKISQFVLDEAYEIDMGLDKTLSHLSENQNFQSSANAQYVLKGANKLADFLSNALDNMKNASPSMGQGKGKKGKGFSLPDIIKKQGESISKMQEGLKKKQGDKPNGKKKGEKKGDKKGKKGKQGKEGKNGKKSGDGESARQYELYKQQQRIKEDLQQLGEKFSDKATQQKIKDLAKKMEDLQKRLLREGITQSTLNKMIQLQHELLKLKNATFTQHEDDQRQSITNQKRFSGFDSIFSPENPLFVPQNELLKRKQLPVNQKVKQKIKQYLK